jgi:membrane peptidoglycan carboxypeptidase
MKDVYSVGYTPQIVTGVWMGNSDGTPMSSRDLSSAMGPGQLWRDFMRSAHTILDLKSEDWPRPAGIVTANVAVAPGAMGGYGSGLLATSLTPFTSSEFFVRGAAPTRQDDWFEACPTGRAAGQEGAAIGTARMVIKEAGPPSWTRDRDRWISEAMAGAHDHGRFPWSRMLSRGGPCAPASPSASPSASESASPSGSGRPSPSTLVTPPTITLPPLTPRPSTPPPPSPPNAPTPTPTPRRT